MSFSAAGVSHLHDNVPHCKISVGNHQSPKLLVTSHLENLDWSTLDRSVFLVVIVHMYKQFTLGWEATFSRVKDSSSSASAMSLATCQTLCDNHKIAICAVEIVSCTQATVADRQLELEQGEM